MASKGQGLIARLRYVAADFRHRRTYRYNNEAIMVLEKWAKTFGGRRHPVTMDRLVSASIVSTHLRMIERGLDKLPPHEAEKLEAGLGI